MQKSHEYEGLPFDWVLCGPGRPVSVPGLEKFITAGEDETPDPESEDTGGGE